MIVVLGPTATGKSELGLLLAKAFGGEIVNADSMQVYKLMDIGTAKPPPHVRKEVPHHMIDLVFPDEPFSAGQYKTLGRKAIEEILSRGHVPLVVGGTGLYIRALLEGLIEGLKGNEGIRKALYEEAKKIGNLGLWKRLAEIDPEAARRIHPHDLYRIVRALEIYESTRIPPSQLRQAHGFRERPYETLKIGLFKPREELYRRIEERVDEMIKQGLVDEVKGLLEKGYGPELNSMKAIGYREIIRYLMGEISLEGAIRLIKLHTRHFAKRQMTWFKKDPEVQWVRYPDEVDRIFELVKGFLGDRDVRGKGT